MSKVIIKCMDCGKKKRITKRHKTIIGNQCMDCFNEESSRECIRHFYDEIYGS